MPLSRLYLLAGELEGKFKRPGNESGVCPTVAMLGHKQRFLLLTEQLFRSN